MKKIFFALAIIVFFNSCHMEELPQAQIARSKVFNSEGGLKMYTNSFYNVFPNRTDIYSYSYYIAINQVIQYFTANGYSPEESGDGIGVIYAMSIILFRIVQMNLFLKKSGITI